MITHRRGSALLSALFIMTLVAIATTALMLQLNHNIEQARLIISTNQFHQDATALRYWAMSTLSNPKYSDVSHKPGTATLTSQNIPLPKIQGVHLSAEIIDLHARFNINNLKKNNHHSSAKTTFYRLSKNLLEDSTGRDAYRVTQTLTQWINNTKSGASHPMVSLSEMHQVHGITPKTYQALEPYLTALPPHTQVNINTASDMLLTAMAQGADTKQAIQELIKARGEKGISSPQAVRGILKKMSIPIDDVCTDSDYFLSVGYAHSTTQNLTVYSLLRRIKEKKGGFSVQLIHETWNTN
jgi:general secretion pathway protein K